MTSDQQKTVLILLVGGVAVWYFYGQVVGAAPVAEGDGSTDSTFLDEAYIMATGVPSYINTWADAIQQHEGWYPGSRSYRNNNPGNLRVMGDLGVDSGQFGVFSTYDKGRAALVADLSAKVRKYSTWSLYDVMSRYAPPSENDTLTYTQVVANALGVTVDTPVGDLAAAVNG